jgi:hypothetical protein
MSPVPNIGLAEVLILAGCSGLVLLIGVIAVAVILTQRKRRDTLGGGAGANETDRGEERPTTTRLRYALLAILFLLALGVLVALDVLASASIYLRFVAVYAAFWVLVGVLLLRGSPARRRFLILGFLVIAVFSVHFINWNSRKPFLKDLYRIKEGMTEAQVEQIMGKHIKEIDLPGSPPGGATEKEDLSPRNSVLYRHTDEGWGDSEWGVITFENGHVARTEFVGLNFSPRSTPPGADAAGGGLGQARYVFLRWKEGLTIMIWHDILGSGEGKGSGSTTDPVYRYRGYAESLDGGRFDWEVQTLDGKTALFWIDDTSYDLSDGTLFIVTTQDGKTEVKQLHRDLSGVQTDRESIIAFAQNDPDIIKFARVTPDSP